MSASRAAASSARLPPWIPGVATPAFWFVVRSKGDYPSQMEAQRGGTRWLSRDSPPRGLAALCRRERSGEAAFATGRRFQSGFTQVRDAPRPSQAAARCRSADRAPRSVGTWPHGRGCGSWALSPPGHHPPSPFAPPSLFFERQRPQRGQNRGQGRVRGALEQNLCLQRSLCFLPWVTGQPGLGHASGGRLSGVGSLQHVEMPRGDRAPSVYQSVVSPHSRWF